MRTASKTGSINWAHLVTVVSVMLLVGTEVFGLGFAAGWALGGLFDVGDRVTYSIIAILCALGAYSMWLLWQRCILVDPIRKRE